MGRGDGDRLNGDLINPATLKFICSSHLAKWCKSLQNARALFSRYKARLHSQRSCNFPIILFLMEFPGKYDIFWSTIRFHVAQASC